MLSRTTKSGKTMYVTEYKGSEHASMNLEAVQLLEAGKVDALTFTPKDNITFVNVKGTFNGKPINSNRPTPGSLAKFSREETLILARKIKADVDQLVSGLS